MYSLLTLILRCFYSRGSSARTNGEDNLRCFYSEGASIRMPRVILRGCTSILGIGDWISFWLGDWGFMIKYCGDWGFDQEVGDGDFQFFMGICPLGMGISVLKS